MLYLGTTRVSPTILEEKYNLGINNVFGNVNSSGQLQPPSVVCDAVFNGVKDLSANVLQYKFYRNNGIRNASFPDLTTVSTSNSAYYAFDTSSLASLSCPNLTNIPTTNCFYHIAGNCPNLKSIDFSSLTNISGSSGLGYAFTASGVETLNFPALTQLSGGNAFNNMCANCSSLTSISFPELTTVVGNGAMAYACNGCSSLTTVNFPKLTRIGNTSGTTTNNLHLGQAFRNCTNLTLTFPELTSIYCTGTATQGTFYYCDGIQKLYFPKLDTITYGAGATTANQAAFKAIFTNCNNLTEIHFGLANKTAIEANAGYSTLWGRGAGNATVYFDL